MRATWQWLSLLQFLQGFAFHLFKVLFDEASPSFCEAIAKRVNRKKRTLEGRRQSSPSPHLKLPTPLPYFTAEAKTRMLGAKRMGLSTIFSLT
jgi:hypothetical protein